MSKIKKIAERLYETRMKRAPYETLAGDLAPDSISQAYAAQAEYQALLSRNKGPIAGRKIALSSKPLQELCGIDHPIAGAVFSKEIHDNHSVIALADFINLGLEFELAVEIESEVPPQTDHTSQSVLKLIKGVRPAFEFIEDRAADYASLDALTLAADNAWCGGIVLGEPIENWQQLDLNNTPSRCMYEGEEDELGNTGAADPFGSLAWVLNHFGERNETVEAGEQIITGSVIRTKFPQLGDKVTYVVGDIASVSVSFV